MRRFHREGILFPRRVRRGIGKGDILWGRLDHCRVIQILHNPRYAGAFAYGRIHSVPTRDLKSTTQVKVERDQWQVLIQTAHPGYISWDEFERNEMTLRGSDDSSAHVISPYSVGCFSGGPNWEPPDWLRSSYRACSCTDNREMNPITLFALRHAVCQCTPHDARR